MNTPSTHFQNTDQYIKTFPTNVQSVLQTLRKTINDEIPGAVEVISYNMPAFTLNGVRIIYFAAWKNHIALYPFSSEMEIEIKGSSDYKTSGKGTIQFPLNKPLPLDLIRAIVQFRLNDYRKKQS